MSTRFYNVCGCCVIIVSQIVKSSRKFSSSVKNPKTTCKMSDVKSEIDSDIEQNYSLNSTADPKNMQELSIYVSNNP